MAHNPAGSLAETLRAGPAVSVWYHDPPLTLLVHEAPPDGLLFGSSM
jgi:hypothetical protein